MSRYAADTSVPADRSRGEIESTLRRYGATGFGYGWQADRAIVTFEMADRRVKFILPMPDRNDPDFTQTPTGRERSQSQAEKAWEQATRQRWRALSLVIKAKLEAVEAGITVFEDEFMAHIVMPNGQTIGDWAKPQLSTMYESGKMPPLLPGANA